MRRAILWVLLMAAGCGETGGPEPTECGETGSAAINAYCPSGYVATCPDAPVLDCVGSSPSQVQYVKPLCEVSGEPSSCSVGWPECEPVETVSGRCGAAVPVCPPESSDPAGGELYLPECPEGLEPACWGPNPPTAGQLCGSNAETSAVICNVDGDPSCRDQPGGSWRPTICVPCD